MCNQVWRNTQDRSECHCTFKLAVIRWSYGSRSAWCSQGSQTPGTRHPAGLQAARPFCSRSDLEGRGACGPPRPDPQTRPNSNFRPWPAQTQTATEFQTPTQAWPLTPNPDSGPDPWPIPGPPNSSLTPTHPPSNSSDRLNSRRPTPGLGLQPRPRPTRTPVRLLARLAAP